MNNVYFIESRMSVLGSTVPEFSDFVVKNGWRFFIRFSRYFDCDGNVIARRNPRTNELRRQVQVYLDNVNAGW